MQCYVEVNLQWKYKCPNKFSKYMFIKFTFIKNTINGIIELVEDREKRILKFSLSPSFYLIKSVTICKKLEAKFNVY